MSQRPLIARVCAYNFLFYAAVFAILMKAPTFGGAPPASAPGAADPAPFEIAADTGAPLAGAALLDALSAGGLVLFVRHFETARSGITDDLYNPQHAHLPLDVFADCAWQRPLSDAGVRLARRAGQILAGWDVPVGAVYASPYCRTMETAQALFRRTPIVDRGLVFRSESYTVSDANRHLMDRYLSSSPPAGENIAIVGHRPPMDALGGIGEGETIVFRPTAEGLELVARIPAQNWLAGDLDVALLAGASAREARTRTLGGRYVAKPRAHYAPVETLIGTRGAAAP